MILKELQEALRLAEEKVQRAEEEREWAVEETQRAEEERQLAVEKAQFLEEESRASNLAEYLRGSHMLLCETLKCIERDPHKTTKGKTAKPDNKIRPNRMEPWDDFPGDQTRVFDLMLKEHAERKYPRMFESKVCSVPISSLSIYLSNFGSLP